MIFFSLIYIVGDGRMGHLEDAPYDAIHVGAAAPVVPQAVRINYAFIAASVQWKIYKNVFLLFVYNYQGNLQILNLYTEENNMMHLSSTLGDC